MKPSRISISGLCLLLVAIFAVITKARAYLTPEITTIVIDAQFKSSFEHETEPAIRQKLASYVSKSHVLSRENIEQIAAKYLTEKLSKDKISVVIWNVSKVDKISDGPTTLFVTLVYNFWPEDIDGKSVILGAIATHAGRYRTPSNPCFDRTATVSSVEPFVASDEPDKMQPALENTVARLLDSFSSVRAIPGNE